MTAHVYKAGLVSAVGHDHERSAPFVRGAVDATAQLVKLYAKAGGCRFGTRTLSDKECAQIQSTMLGSEVLDAAEFPVIAFVSTGAGNLTLHGRTHTVDVDVRETSGH